MNLTGNLGMDKLVMDVWRERMKLMDNLRPSRLVDQFGRPFELQCSGTKIGDVVNVRRPQRFQENPK